MATFTKIASVTVGAGGASTVDFSSIPSTYTDLCLKASVRSTEGSVYGGIYVSYNGAAYNSTGKVIEGDGSAVSSFSFTNGAIAFIAGSSATANTFGSTELYIPNYASSNYKNYSSDGVGENNATLALAHLDAGLWSNTAAINQITLKPYSTNTFVQYSTFVLYGISKS